MSSTTATVLFTDLVDSTRLTVELGAVFAEARRAHDSALRSVVASHRGRLIKGTGDGLMATFDAGVDAVAAARAAQQSIHRLNRQGREPSLSIRVGMAAGDVSWEDDDCFGEPVIEAARLCDRAAGGQILATDLVQAIAGGRRASGFVDHGALELKGLPGPTDVVEVVWEPDLRSPMPLPTRLLGEHDAFVGRAAELRALHHLFDAAVEEGRRRVVLIGGEPGLGKTALVSQAARAWHEAGAVVAMGRCEEDVRSPYRPFVDVLGQLVAGAPPELLQAHVDRRGAPLVSLAPQLATRVPDLPAPVSTDPESERFLLFSAVADLLDALAEETPLVVFLDDLHWADAGTASLLRALASSSDPARLVIAGTLRIEELAVEHPMGRTLAALRRAPWVTRVHLDGLAGPDIHALVDEWAGGDAGPAAARLADDLRVRTGGNAFFVTEVVRFLKETGRLDALPDAAGTSVMPDSVREVLGDRVGRLGSQGDEVLAVAAVAGSEFDVRLLATVTAQAEHDVLEVLDAAAHAALVREGGTVPGRFGFTHALVQDAILANLGPTRRASLHRRIAEALDGVLGAERPVAELAHHWMQATASDSGRARDSAVEAGDAALAALAPDDAVRFFRQALLLHDQGADGDVPTRIDLLIRLGEAERQAGDPEHRDTLLKAGRLADRIDDGDRLADAALANHVGSFSRFLAVDVDRVAMLERAARVPGDDARRALLLASLASELTYSGRYERRRLLADDALRLARARSDPALLLRVSNLVSMALWVPDTLAERVRLTEESLALADRVGDPTLEFWCTLRGSNTLTQAGRVADADVTLQRSLALADGLAQPAMRWRIRNIAATRLLLAGDPGAAEPLVEEARAIGDAVGEPEARVYHRSQVMQLHWQRGTMTEVAEGVRGRPPKPPNVTASLALIFAEAGRDDDARAHLDRVETALAELPTDPAYLTALACLAEGATLVDHLDAAAPLHEALLPYGDQIGFDGVVTVGYLDHYLGCTASMLGLHDEAVDRLERSVAGHAALPAPFFEARSRYELARALARRGDPADGGTARREAGRTADLAAARGYRKVRRRAEALLDAMHGG